MTANPDLSARHAFAIKLVREAGDIAHGYFRRRAELTVKSKGLQDVVSEADLNTELHIKRRLAETFPDDAFLGEETGITAFSAEQGIWVVDPIDGTQPFVSGMSSWCVSIAYVQGNDIKLGAVYAPVRDELFAGGQGFPATLNGAPVEKHPGRTLQQGIIGVGYSTRVPPDDFLPIFERFLKQGGMFYRDGSGALMLSYVAAGRLLGYVEPHINSWDCLAAIAIIRAAGLETNDFLANDGLNKGNRVIAGNAEVYAALEAVYEGVRR
jgi:myo-inositol-1(or 4)-monophosphatase